jgi:DNA-binding MarR family transcriptional regulator
MTTQAAVGRIRAFNRYYTALVGLLDGEYLGSEFSLVEARVMYEISREGPCTSKAIREATGIDAGYLSRTLGALSRRGLVAAKTSAEDGRCRLVELTRKGEAAYELLDGRSSESVAGLLSGLGAAEKAQLVACLERARELLGEVGAPRKEGEDE